MEDLLEEKLIDFDTAVLAKELGFDIKCKHWYDQTQTLNPVKGIRGAVCYTNEGYAPTKNQLKTWLREVHNIHIVIQPAKWTENTYTPGLYSIDVLTLKEIDGQLVVDTKSSTAKKTYEESLEAALLKGLRILQWKKS